MKMNTAKELLLNIVTQKRVSNGYIFYAQDENASLEHAVYFAKCICCIGENVPCDICSNCSKIQKDIHPDIIFVEKPKNRASISVDSIRELISSVNIKPNEANHKIYIIKNAECLTPSAQNALLKILEEPPINVHFILCATNEGAIITTVKSRCQKLIIRTKENEKSPKTIAFINDFIASLLLDNKYNFIVMSSKLGKDRSKIILQIESLLSYLSDIIAVKNKVLENADISLISAKFTNKSLVALTEKTWEFINQLKQNCNVALAANVYFMSCWEEIH